MAETVYLKNGSVVINAYEHRAEFLENLIRDNLGNDVSDYFMQYVNELKDDVAFYRAQSLDAEREIDGYIDYCREARDTFQIICDKSRNKDITEIAQNAYRSLNSIL